MIAHQATLAADVYIPHAEIHLIKANNLRNPQLRSTISQCRPFLLLSPGRIHWLRSGLCRRFGTPTEPQEQGWPHILAGRTTLISAPTGSGKTLAAFLACIDRLVRKALAGDLADRTEVLYVRR